MQQDNKAIILITDGENHEDDPVEAAKMAAEVGVRVFCIGVGSPEGKPIPYGPDGDLMKDKEGNIVVTRLDEKILEEVAIAGGGAYIRAGNTEFGLNPIIDELKQLQEQQFKSVVFEDYEEQYMYFFAISLVFFLLEFLVGNRRVGKKMFAVVLLLGISVVNSYAQTDKKEVRKGNRLFKDENYKEAEVEYRKALIKDSLSIAGNYNLANTLIKLDDNPNAELIYAKLEDSVARIEHNVNWEKAAVDAGKNTLAPDYYHNLGNSYLAQKKYQEAVEAYKNSLRRNPNDNETRENYIYAKKKLEDQQNQDQNQNQNQDQNQNQQSPQQQPQNQQQNQPDQNKDDKQDQNQNQDNKNDQQPPKENPQNGNPPKIEPQQAEQMLQAIQEKENQTQEKVKEEKARQLKSKQKEKNW